MSVEAVAKDEILLVERKFRANKWNTTADLWRIGVNLALRISDLLTLRYDQLTGDVLEIIEGKTLKKRRIIINNTARQVIEKRRLANPHDVYLFQATGNRVKSIPPKPLSRQYITRHFQAVSEETGLHLGTHSMRKTRGRAMYESGVPIEQICRMLNHTTPAVTMRYIGITQRSIDDTYTAFEL